MKFLSLITRYLNEPFLDEFVDYYLSEGVDEIFVLYDTDSTIPISTKVKHNPKVIILQSTNFKFRQTYDVNRLFDKIKAHFTWVIFVDCDEFISSPRNSKITIKEQLKTTFKDVDCIKIPWVLMSSGGLQEDPPSILQYITRRWNHNLRHPHPNHWSKGRCRYEQIEVKSISKCAKIDNIGLHHPNGQNLHIVESVSGAISKATPFFDNLREYDILHAHMLCYHYRIVSLESAKRKFMNNKLEGYKEGNLENLMLTDYSEVTENIMKEKSIEKFGVIN